jgi:nicotinate-nucleotide adenylyltransferase
VGTLSWLAERNPAAQFAYLMGADSLRDLPSWHTPRELVSACTWIGVMRRPGVEIDLQGLEVRVPGVQAKVRFFDAPEVNLSAHEIRRRIREGKSCRYLVPAGVAQVIEREGLYRD